MKKKIVLGSIILCSTLFAESLKLNINKSIDLAYKNNYTLKNSELDLENSNLKVKEAYKTALPTIDYTGKYSETENQKSYSGSSSNDYYENRIDLTQPLYSGGVITTGIKTARDIKERSIYQFENIKTDVMLTTIQKYIKILDLNKQLEVYKASLKNMDAEYQKAQRKYELNLLSRAGVLPFNTRVLNIRTSILEVENQIEIAKVDLKNYLRIPSTQEIVLEDLIESDYNIERINLNQDIEYVRNNSRNSKIAQLDLKIKEGEKVVARSEFLPKVNLSGGYKSGDIKYNSSADNWEWELGVTVKMNLFEFGKSMDAYKRSKNEVEKSQNTELKVKDDLELDIRKGYLELLKYKG
ncbi:MAG: TolC family protein, partial [Cetobacterium sp.]